MKLTGYIYGWFKGQNIYIGKTVRTFEKRFEEHLKSAFTENRKCYLFLRPILEAGEHVDSTILQELEIRFNEEIEEKQAIKRLSSELSKLETRWIRRFEKRKWNLLNNIKISRGSGSAGEEIPEERKQQISDSVHKWLETEEGQNFIELQRQRNLGNTLSETAREKCLKAALEFWEAVRRGEKEPPNTSEGIKRYWSNLSKEELEEISRKQSEAKKLYYQRCKDEGIIPACYTEENIEARRQGLKDYYEKVRSGEIERIFNITEETIEKKRQGLFNFWEKVHTGELPKPNMGKGIPKTKEHNKKVGEAQKRHRDAIKAGDKPPQRSKKGYSKNNTPEENKAIGEKIYQQKLLEYWTDRTARIQEKEALEFNGVEV